LKGFANFPDGTNATLFMIPVNAFEAGTILTAGYTQQNHWFPSTQVPNVKLGAIMDPAMVAVAVSASACNQATQTCNGLAGLPCTMGRCPGTGK
jgi:hypothetical protein